MIHGETADYNSVALWDYSNVAKTFGPHYPSKYHGPIKTCEQLVALFESGALREECFHMVELKLEPMDLPYSVKLVREAIKK
jgi:pyruvate decarboxylase